MKVTYNHQQDLKLVSLARLRLIVCIKSSREYMNKSRTTDKRWSSSFGFWRGTNN